MQLRKEALRTERDLLYGVIHYMSTCSDIEAQEAFSQLRTCDNPFEVAKNLSK